MGKTLLRLMIEIWYPYIRKHPSWFWTKSPRKYSINNWAQLVTLKNLQLEFGSEPNLYYWHKLSLFLVNQKGRDWPLNVHLDRKTSVRWGCFTKKKTQTQNWITQLTFSQLKGLMFWNLLGWHKFKSRKNTISSQPHQPTLSPHIIRSFTQILKTFWTPNGSIRTISMYTPKTSQFKEATNRIIPNLFFSSSHSAASVYSI